MKLSSLLTIALTVGTFFILSFVLYVLWKMFIPSRGSRIKDYPEPTKALLVMDIQESGDSNHTTKIQLPVTTPFGRMILAVNNLIECFDSSGLEVAYVRQVFASNFITRLHGGRILSGRMEPRICRWVRVVNTNDFAKNRTDAFSNRHLEKFLIDRQVDELFLVGLDAAFCIYYTALGALNRGYRVTVVTDAVMTGRDMDKVLSRYHQKGISVMNSREAIMKVQKKEEP